MTPLEQLTVQQLTIILKLIGQRNNDIVHATEWQRIIDFFDGNQQERWTSTNAVIEWLKL